MMTNILIKLLAAAAGGWIALEAVPVLAAETALQGYADLATALAMAAAALPLVRTLFD